MPGLNGQASAFESGDVTRLVAERLNVGGCGLLTVLRQVADHLDHFGVVIALLPSERQQLPHLGQ
jgi:hypothetical protein